MSRHSGDERAPLATGTAPAGPALLDRWLLVTVLVGALLLLWNLDGRWLWQDEAETALLGRSILAHGVPVAFDGQNLISQEVGREFEAPSYIWRWSPWVQFYGAAAGLKIFGNTTLGARLPFALTGILTIFAVYAAALQISRSRVAARFAALFLALSPWYLLHARQSRWHAPAYLFAALAVLALMRIRDERRWTAVAGLALAGAGLFYTNYLVAIAYLLALAVASPLLALTRSTTIRVAAGFAGAAVLSVPGIVFHRVLTRAGSTSGAFADHLMSYGVSLGAWLLPLPVVALAAWFAIRQRSGRLAFLLAAMGITIIVLSLAPWTMFRYLTVLLPLSTILLGMTAANVARWSRMAAAILVATLIGTTAIHHIGLNPLMADPRYSFSPLLGYLHELRDPPVETEQKLAAALRAGDRSGTVVTTYGDLPLQFYTRLRVCGGLSGRELPTEPDWIIMRAGIMSSEPGKDLTTAWRIRETMALTRYEEVERIPDAMLSNNPDPLYHLFAPKNPEVFSVVYRRST